METRLVTLLYDRYPSLYSGGPHEGEAFSQFGFEVGDGWFDLLDTLSADVMHVVQRIGMPCPHAVQVKSKMGTLRFVLSDFNGPLDALIGRAVKASMATCEQCGLPGGTYHKEPMGLYCLW
ncbi:hypothetical protein [Acidithiobacillus ferrooxidans]|uniref:hypothetical protein n=1 Tax=Acidithiobacillus ferrooxidans TaxID=920 RepID=UPI0015DC44F0|nr:hypothetical protein [Acidithiobacillus ferrooxidans]MCR1341860.1 hypothetical protein [Acidithiobacillus ferrooxidans]QLK42567.1 hypothetical protein FE661_10650 [Acidithiobacillus ferrooxidans]QZT51649.1 hypothetical protein K7B00_10630 [Acidithiobacillus ferrooxidans]BDB15012.1 hypothetical protein ANFP_23320 [Acidithiobacillus ferrooxidans]